MGICPVVADWITWMVLPSEGDIHLTDDDDDNDEEGECLVTLL